MTAPRGTELLLQIMQSHPGPKSVLDLARAARITRGRAHRIVEQLCDAGLLQRLPEESRTGAIGRHPRRYALPGWEPGRTATASPLRPLAWPVFLPRTMVLTPQGRKAVVLRQADSGLCDCQYVDEWVKDERALLTIHARLLRAFQADRAWPEPVRIA